jgi:hypothetical protein
MRTFEPRPAFVFDAGFCAVTVPFGSAPGTWNATGTRPAALSAVLAAETGCPTTSGTVACPFETLSATVEPLATLVPCFGRSATTTPVGAFAGTLVTWDRKPTAFSRVTACVV